MDQFAKYIPLIATLLGLLGPAITFINGRLSEAKTPEHRERIWRITFAIADALIIVAAFICLELDLFNVAGVLAGLHLLYTVTQITYSKRVCEPWDVVGIVHSTSFALIVIISGTNYNLTALRNGANVEIQKLEKRLDALEKAQHPSPD